MIERFLRDSRTIARMRDGIFGKYFDSFARELNEQGYANSTACVQMRLVAGFARWLMLNEVPLLDITNAHAKKYLEQRKQRPLGGEEFALKRILNLLREAGAIAPEPSIEDSSTPAQRMTEQFSVYLKKERSLALGTIQNYEVFVIRFLCDRFADTELSLSSLCPVDVIDFVRRQAATLHRKRSKVMTAALRSFFQYAQYQGLVKSNLAAAVPTVANWKMTEIPKALPLDQVEQAIVSCNRQTGFGRRDYAILLLLARLGLRAGEVAFLTLDNIDWQNGYIIVRGKGGFFGQLPLPVDVGEALADYLQNGRPQTSSRNIFLRQNAPIVGFSGQRAVGNVVARALARAGIEAPRKGAHQLRHAFASKLLQGGATLTEIGELLGHQSVQTTAIYTKIDLVSLRALVMPWPGGVQ